MTKGEANLIELTTLISAYLFLLDRGHEDAAFDLEKSVKDSYPSDIWNDLLNEATGASDNEPDDWRDMLPPA